MAVSSTPSGNDSGQWEKNYQSVCALGIVHGGLGGRHEGDLWILSVPTGVPKVYGHMLVQGENRFDIMFIFF